MIFDENKRVTEDGLRRFDSVVNSHVNPIKFLGIDPGQHNGVCGYDEKMYLQFMMTVEAEDMAVYLDCFKNLELIVIEKFRLYPNKAHKQIYSEMLTSKVVGRVEGWATHNKVALVQQPATVKKTGYAWLGQKIPSKSDPRNHEMDAHVHFIYWAVSSKKMGAEQLVRRLPTDEVS